jgi:ADP-heptose:LPS heptosyltransferase
MKVEASRQVKETIRRTKRWTRDAIRPFFLPRKKSIHLFRDGALGDVLMCTPGMRKLKQTNPMCRIHFYTDYPDVVRGLWYLDEVLPSDKRPVESIYLSYEHVKTARYNNHLSKAMAAKIGVRVKDVKPDCVVNEKLTERFKAEWWSLPRPHVVIHRRAGPWTPNKNWPDESWESLLKTLLRTRTIIEIGTRDDDAGIFDSNYIDLRGKTTLAELVAVLAAADVMIGPDSGPMHIAAAVKTPAVVILGGYSGPGIIAYPGNVVLHTPIACSPCFLRTPCPIDRECLRRISVEMIEKKIQEILEI